MEAVGGSQWLQKRAARRTEREQMLAIVRPSLWHVLASKQPPRYVDFIVAVLRQFGRMDEAFLINRILGECPGIVDAEKFREAVTAIEARVYFRSSPETALAFLCLHHLHVRWHTRMGPFSSSNRLDVTSREAPQRARDPYSLPRVQEAIGERFLRLLSTVIGDVFRMQHVPEPWHIVRGDDFDTRIDAALIQWLFPHVDAAAPATRWWRRFFPHPLPLKPDSEHLTKAFALLARDFREWLIIVHDGEYAILDDAGNSNQEDGVMIRYREEEGITSGIIECIRWK